MTEAFRKEVVNERLNYIDDGHWNAKGHAVAANTIMRFLEAKGWAKSGSDLGVP